ncbi:hypothetical protein [Acidisoma sp. S159]|uniref:hypothetical protein n=1 Tax=Acidisoma sp. S159 TaxID=1747225 RepID=UPI00131AD0D0|nr:hypothetical protein [Acidisoma sp. S159]
MVRFSTIAATFLLLVSVPAYAQSYPTAHQIDVVGHTVGKIMHDSGMNGVSKFISMCYIQDYNDKAKLRGCMLADLVAHDLDAGMRMMFKSQTGNDPGPATPFLSASAWDTRVQIYVPRVFGTVDAARDYFYGHGNSVTEAENVVNQ